MYIVKTTPQMIRVLGIKTDAPYLAIRPHEMADEDIIKAYENMAEDE